MSQSAAPPEFASLAGRVALVTGVSRRIGIADAIARRLAERGAIVHATGWTAHDAEMPWGADDHQLAAGHHARPFSVEERNLEVVDEPTHLIDAVVAKHGAIDIVVAVHARSSSQSLDAVTAEDLDRSWAANVRSIVQLAQRFASVHDRSRHLARGGEQRPEWGRMIWFTSGQNLQPMPGEIAYAVTKGALQAMTPTLAEPLGDAGIVANCINPGPVDTGYADAETKRAVARMFPGNQWGTPTDVANLVEFLVSDQGAWIHGQVLNSEGGFRRFRRPIVRESRSAASDDDR